MRLGYFGGSFDPPHCGHLTIALAAARQFALDCVWLAPTGRQPLKRQGAEASFADRFAMTQLLCAGDDRLLASEVDGPRPDGGPNYTVEALRQVRDEAPDAALFAIIGADALGDLPRWHEAGQLFALATWIAVSRPGYSLSGALPETLRSEMERNRLCLLPDIDVPVSSTKIRQGLRHGEEPTRAQLPDAVLDYVRQHRLYAGQAPG